MAPIPDPIRRDASTPQKWDDQCGPERYPRETDADNVIAPEEGVLSTRIDPEERTRQRGSIQRNGWQPGSLPTEVRPPNMARDSWPHAARGIFLGISQ